MINAFKELDYYFGGALGTMLLFLVGSFSAILLIALTIELMDANADRSCRRLGRGGGMSVDGKVVCEKPAPVEAPKAP